MEFREFTKRCEEEYKAKNPKRWIIGRILSGAGIAYIIFAWVVAGANGYSHPGILDFLIFAILNAVSVFFYQDKAMTSTVSKYKKSEEYKNYPVDHPYSFVYPGETWPFGRTDVQPQVYGANDASVAHVKVNRVSSVAAPAPVAAPTQPQQVTITCSTCGQPMLIPVSNGAVKITCPKCGNSFIHTN